jgi:hypothetical protein
VERVNGSVQPVVRLALPNVEVPVAFLDVNVVAESSQFVIDGFERERHGGYRKHT